jgi:hypothetical protein
VSVERCLTDCINERSRAVHNAIVTFCSASGACISFKENSFQTFLTVSQITVLFLKAYGADWQWRVSNHEHDTVR